MHDDVEDHATLKRHHQRLEALHADLERSPSKETIAAMLGVCAAVRRIDNPRYRYAVEQIVWIKGPLESLRTGIDLISVGQGVTRLRNALQSLVPREREAGSEAATDGEATK